MAVYLHANVHVHNDLFIVISLIVYMLFLVNSVCHMLHYMLILNMYMYTHIRTTCMCMHFCVVVNGIY
jgi:hypothetical protein